MTWSWREAGAAPAIYWLRSLDVQHQAAHACSHWLDARERERAGRFLFEQDRLDFIASRILLRGVLGGLLGRAPGDLVFERSSTGKPHLPGIGLQFNLSHTGGASALMVGPAPGAGVDIERIDRMSHGMELLQKSVLAESERAWLAHAGAATPEYAQRWARLWTAKEALLKFDGGGIGRCELACIEVIPGPGEQVAYANLPPGVRSDYPAAGWCRLGTHWICSWVGHRPGQIHSLGGQAVDGGICMPWP